MGGWGGGWVGWEGRRAEGCSVPLPGQLPAWVSTEPNACHPPSHPPAQMMELDWPRAVMRQSHCKEVKSPDGTLVYRCVSVRLCGAAESTGSAGGRRSSWIAATPRLQLSCAFASLPRRTECLQGPTRAHGRALGGGGHGGAASAPGHQAPRLHRPRVPGACVREGGRRRKAGVQAAGDWQQRWRILPCCCPSAPPPCRP